MPPVKKQMRRILRKALNSRVGYGLKGWLQDSGPARREGIRTRDGRSSAEVIAYFGDRPDRLYQLQQWLTALEKVNETRSVALVFRDEKSFEAAGAMTELPVVVAVTQPDLVDLYASESYKLAMYVNNGMKNFQSMAEPSIIHVHVDHGESDKKSSISNQLKAYDKIFVAGPAAKERCQRELWGLDERKMVSIGRPPLDGVFASVLPHDGRETVVYAPTWQGENEANNFTSVDVLGPQIVKSLLSMPVRVVYRPHPRIGGMAESAVSSADREIKSMIDAANDQGGAHIVSTDLNILDIFVDADLLIADISSVGLDFLYLHTEKGLLLTDRHNDRARMQSSSPIGAVLGAVSLNTIGQLPSIVDEALQEDKLQDTRRALRDHYFGEKTAHGSTSKFVVAVDEAIRERESWNSASQR